MAGQARTLLIATCRVAGLALALAVAGRAQPGAPGPASSPPTSGSSSEAPVAASSTVPTTGTTDHEKATLALLAARVEIFSLLAGQERKDEALAELEAITALRNLEDDEEAQELLLSAYLEGVEFLLRQGEDQRAESLSREGLTRFRDRELHRGYFLMSLAKALQRQGQADRALATLREATAIFERVRAK